MASRIWIVGLSAGLIAFLTACSSAPPQGPGGAGGQSGGGRTTAVSVAPVTKGAIQSALSYSGVIQAKAQVGVAPKVAGRIEKLAVDVGDTVHAGDVIAELEKSSAKVQVQQAEAALSSAKAKLATITAGPRPDDLVAAEAAVRSAQAKVDQLTPTDSDVATAEASLAAAQAQLTKAQNDLAKLQAGPDPDAVKQAELDVEKAKASLWYSQSSRDGQCSSRNPAYQCDSANGTVMSNEVSVQQAKGKLDTLKAGPKPEDIATAEQNVASARAAVASAQAKLDQVNAGPKATDLVAAQAAFDQAESQLRLKRNPYSPEDVKVAEAAVEQAAATLSSAQLALAETTLVAPFDGVIASRNLSEGALATTQSPIVTIVSKDIEIQLSVEEGRIGLIRPQLPVSLMVPAYPGVAFQGSVSIVAPVADPKSHTFVVKVAPDNSSGKLSPGMFADVSVMAERKDGALLVPRDALIQQSDRQIVYVAKDGQAVLREVKVGLVENKNVEILDGVADDDQVIVAGLGSLSNGSRIMIPGQGASPGAGPDGQGGPGASGKPGGQGGPGASGKPGGPGASGKPSGSGGAGTSGKPGGQ